MSAKVGAEGLLYLMSAGEQPRWSLQLILLLRASMIPTIMVQNMYMHMYIHIHVYTYVHIHMHICMCIRIYIYTHVHIHMYFTFVHAYSIIY